MIVPDDFVFMTLKKFVPSLFYLFISNYLYVLNLNFLNRSFGFAHQVSRGILGVIG